MKKQLILAVIAIAFIFTSSIASAFNSIEKVAQQDVYNYLRNQGYKTQIDDRDNSVMFFKNDKFYYITFKGDGKGVLYTLYAEPLKFEFKDRDRFAHLKETAVISANMLNATGFTKVYLENNRLNFTFPIFAKTPELYIKILNNLIDEIENTRAQNFDKYFNNAKIVTDSIHNYWATNDTTKLIVPQRHLSNNIQKRNNNLKIENVAFRNVNFNGEEITNYNASLRSSDLEFIQPKITISAPKKGEYVIGVKIINPKGKILVAEKEAQYTIENILKVDKNPKEIEFLWFGAEDPGLWIPGDYTVIFYNDDLEIKKTNFTVL